MNDNKYLRFWKWAVILLVLCNIGLIATIWFKPHDQGGPRHGEETRNYVIKTLKFSDEQVKQYDALIALHQEAMKQVRREAMDSRTQLFTNLTNNNQNPAVADSLAVAVANSQKKIELVTYNHFAEVRKICSDAQKAEFDKIIVDVTRRMNGRGGPPQEGPGRPGEGRDGPPPPPRDRPGPPENE